MKLKAGLILLIIALTFVGCDSKEKEKKISESKIVVDLAEETEIKFITEPINENNSK